MRLRARLRRIEDRLPTPPVEIIVKLVEGPPSEATELAILRGDIIYVSDVDHDVFMAQLRAKYGYE
jgi:hypothetical protein